MYLKIVNLKILDLFERIILFLNSFNLLFF